MAGKAKHVSTGKRGAAPKKGVTSFTNYTGNVVSSGKSSGLKRTAKGTKPAKPGKVT